MLRHDESFDYLGIDPLCQATDEGLGVADDEVPGNIWKLCGSVSLWRQLLETWLKHLMVDAARLPRPERRTRPFLRSTHKLVVSLKLSWS